MLEDTLKVDGRISDKRIERFKRNVFLVRFQIFRAPKLLITEKIVLCGAPAGKGEPLDIIGFADVIEGGIIERRMCRRDRHDGGKVRRKLLCCRPLIEPGVGAAPHCDFSIAERLLGEPLHDVAAVVWLLRERFELTAGIAAAAHIDKCEGVTMRCKISGASMIAVGGVRRQGENYRRPRECSISCSR